MIKVGIVGGTGYTGSELLRLLSTHPHVQVHVVTSRSEQGLKVSDIFPNLRGHIDLPLVSPDPESLRECDLVFFATPHGMAMSAAPPLLEAGVRVVDLSADFRLKDVKVWEHWYGMPHSSPEWLKQAVYGLPEVWREAIKDAKLVANPGCYPTAVQLGFLPLVEKGVVRVDRLIADAKSGVSGAGRKTSISHLLTEASDSMKAYSVGGHRHLPEIQQGLTSLSRTSINLVFVPHLIPMIRGIHATLYAELTEDEVSLQDLYEIRYRDEPFVDVMPAGSHPETRSVRGSNVCRIAAHRQKGGKGVVILSVIDNLVKGAAGQAIQNMNIMFGLDETTGLNHPALMP
jgi:N-acetyl-gamma-glutamyl-phosphate reductase